MKVFLIESKVNVTKSNLYGHNILKQEGQMLKGTNAKYENPM